MRGIWPARRKNVRQSETLSSGHSIVGSRYGLMGVFRRNSGGDPSAFLRSSTYLQRGEILIDTFSEYERWRYATSRVSFLPTTTFARSPIFRRAGHVAAREGNCKDDKVCYYFTVVYLKGIPQSRYAEAIPCLNH